MKKNLNANSERITGTNGASSQEALNFKAFDPVVWRITRERRFTEEELEMVEYKATIVVRGGLPAVQFNVKQVEDQDREEHLWLPLSSCDLSIGDEIYVRDLMVQFIENNEGQKIVRLGYDTTPTEDEKWEYWEAFDMDALQ